MSMQKVLIVDNVNSVIDFAKSVLSRPNVAVYAAASGQEAIDIHKRERANLILLDNTPSMNGEDVCKVIKNNDSTKNTAIIMSTTGLKIGDIEKYEDIEKYINSIGADDYITKPFNPADLVKKVSRFISIPVRENIRILTRLTIDAKIGTEPFMGNTVDISTNGMLLGTEKLMDIGNTVKCIFSIPDVRIPITVTGNVIRKINSKVSALKMYGIKFADLGSMDEMTIGRYVFKQQRQQLREKISY